MRLWLCIALVVCVMGGIGYWWTCRDETPSLDPTRVAAPKPPVKNDGDAESCDANEPLVVDPGRKGFVASNAPPAVEMEAQPRVVLAPGMTQPARPDDDAAQPGYMPYADEPDFETMRKLCFAVDHMLRVLGEVLPGHTTRPPRHSMTWAVPNTFGRFNHFNYMEPFPDYSK